VLSWVAAVSTGITTASTAPITRELTPPNTTRELAPPAATREPTPPAPAPLPIIPSIMAPTNQPGHNEFEAEIKHLIQGCYEIMLQAKAYDTTHVLGSEKPIMTRNVLQDSFQRLHASLQQIHSMAILPNNLPQIPPEIIEYVVSGRNPDIYTREFVELARKNNQLLKGKQEAFGSFADILGQSILKVLPELRPEVESVMDSTGRDKKVLDDLA